MSINSKKKEVKCFEKYIIYRKNKYKRLSSENCWYLRLFKFELRQKLIMCRHPSILVFRYLFLYFPDGFKSTH